MKVVIFGASGLIGRGVLRESLEHPRVEGVLSVGRRRLDVSHPKLRQVIHEDFLDFTTLAEDLRGLDACFWCLGTTSAGLDEAEYTRITYDFTMAAARVLLAQSPGLCFCFVSGGGTDASERGLFMWARVKGRTENALSGLGFREVFHFRPGFIQVTRGENPRGPLARGVLASLYPALRRLGAATSNGDVGRAMIAATLGMSAKRILGSKDIDELSGKL